MKRFYLISVLAVISFMSSCRTGGNEISEVKLIPVKNGGDFQYINTAGEIEINPQFKNATIFREQVALVQTSSDDPKYGFVDEDGRYIINAVYKDATVFSEGVAWVVAENAAPAAIDNQGNIKFTLKEAEEVRTFKNGLAAFRVIGKEGKANWGFVDKEGKVAINPQFSSVSAFSDGKCAVESHEGKWGYINHDGKIAINYQFDEAYDFKNGLSVVCLDDKYGAINAVGKYLINPQYSNMYTDGNSFLIEQDGRYGWCDNNGNITINPQFAEAFPFKGSKVAAVLSGGSYGYINKSGKIVINPQFDLAYPFNGKIAMVSLGGNIGFINTEGKFVINPQFDGTSEDFVNHLLNGASTYQSVRTDYFDITSIVKQLNINNSKSVVYSRRLSDVIAQLDVDESDFYEYSNLHKLIRDSSITSDARISIYVQAKAFKEIPDGWYTKKVFNPEASVSACIIVISLSPKRDGKEKYVFQAFEKEFSAYKSDLTHSSVDRKVYTHENTQITLVLNEYDQVEIWVEKANQDDK